MTVDMLAAAFIWPEEMLVGRNIVGDGREPRLADDAAIEMGSSVEPDPAPFWAALVRRFRADPTLPGVALR